MRNHKIKNQGIIFSRIAIVLMLLVLNSHVGIAEESKVILFVHKSEPTFQEVFQRMTRSLRRYTIKEFLIQKTDKYEIYRDKIKEVNPDLMILMDNNSVEFGIKWNQESAKKIPGIAIMGLNFQTLLRNNPYISGIAFESPAYSLIAQFRVHVEAPVKNVLVFYRKSVFSEMIDQAISQLKTEKITLTPIDVEQDGKGKEEVEKFLMTKGAGILAEQGKFDAIWCLLDSVLMSKKLFLEFWRPNISNSKLPLLVGVEQYVEPAINFGTFGVTPNLPDLASQAGQMVERILEDKENPRTIGVEQTVSVDKVLNKRRIDELKLKIVEKLSSDVKILE